MSTHIRAILPFQLLLILISLSQLCGASPRSFSYQGYLEQGGVPVEGTRNLVFTIYDAPAAGIVIWQESHANIAVTAGLFSVSVGTGNHVAYGALDQVDFSDTTRYLGITIGVFGVDPEISPRTRLVSVPYALRVATIDGASGGTLSSGLTVNGNIISAPRNRSFTVSSSELQPESETIKYLKERAFISGTQVGQFMIFRAPVVLPPQALITGLDMYVCYNDTTRVEVNLYRQSGTVHSIIGTIVDNGGHLSSCEQTIDMSLAHVVSDGWAYVVEAKFRATSPMEPSSNATLGNIHVYYTVSNLTP